MTTDPSGLDAHEARIRDQFSRQAKMFAASPELHNEAALALLTSAAAPQPSDNTLDVACGPGSVVLAMAGLARHATGLDATPAMLAEAAAGAEAKGIINVSWRQGDVYALPFANGAFDIVSCRFAFHHFERPLAALREMVRVCRPRGTILLCDAYASDDPAKAAAFNRMEKLRDPSTAMFSPLDEMLALFAMAGLPEPAMQFFQVPAEREMMITSSFPENGDHDGLRQMLNGAAEGDLMGLNMRRDGNTVLYGYPSVILTARRP